MRHLDFSKGTNAAQSSVSHALLLTSALFLLGCQSDQAPIDFDLPSEQDLGIPELPEEPEEPVVLESRMSGERKFSGIASSSDPLSLVYSGTSYGANVAYAQGGRVNGNFGGAFYSVSALHDGRFRTDTFLFNDQSKVANSRVDAPSQGTATFSGRYEMRSATNIERGLTRATFDSEYLSGDITLDADFTNNSITSTTSDFTLDGSFAGAKIEGTVTHNGIVGDMNGLLTKPDSGQDVILLRGAFQGADEQRGAAFAGGLVAIRP